LTTSTDNMGVEQYFMLIVLETQSYHSTEPKIKGFKIVNFFFECKNRWIIFFFNEFQQIMAKIFT